MAHVTIGNDGRISTVRLEFTQRMLEGTVRTFVEQATFPVGCEGKTLDLVFEFVFRDVESERAETKIEILPSGAYRITANLFPPFLIAD